MSDRKCLFSINSDRCNTTCRFVTCVLSPSQDLSNLAFKAIKEDTNPPRSNNPRHKIANLTTILASPVIANVMSSISYPEPPLLLSFKASNSVSCAADLASNLAFIASISPLKLDPSVLRRNSRSRCAEVIFSVDRSKLFFRRVFTQVALPLRQPPSFLLNLKL